MSPSEVPFLDEDFKSDFLRGATFSEIPITAIIETATRQTLSFFKPVILIEIISV